MTNPMQIDHLNNGGKVLTYSEPKTGLEGMFIIVPWLKPMCAAKSGNIDHSRIKNCQLRVEWFQGTDAIKKYGPELATQNADAVFHISNDRVPKVTVESGSLTFIGEMCNDLSAFWTDAPLEARFVASVPWALGELCSYDSGTLLRRLYRNMFSTEKGKYPAKDKMIERCWAMIQEIKSLRNQRFEEEQPQGDEPMTEETIDISSMSINELSTLAGKASAAQKAKMTMMKRVGELTTKLEEKEQELKQARIHSKPEPVAIASPDGKTIDLLGTTLPVWGCDEAPKPDDRYDITAWRAQLKVSDETFTANAAEVAKSIIDGDSVRLIGPPSVGKTSGIKEVAALTGAKFFLVQCGEGATDLSLIGCQTVSEGSMSWQDGSITTAVRWASDNPDTLTIIVLDEVDHLMPEVQSLLHGVLEGGNLQYDGNKELTVSDNVRFVATANTSGFGDISGRHASAKISDTAFVSRWNVTYDVTYLPPEAESVVLQRSGATKDDADSAVKVAHESRIEGSSLTQPIVLRQLLSWSRGCGAGEDPKKAWAFRVLASLPEHDRPAAWEISKLQFGW